MSNSTIRTLLEQLRNEIQSTELDAETQALISELDNDIHALANTEHGEESSVLQRARRLEGRFAAEHPTAERIVAEVINTLSKMGI